MNTVSTILRIRLLQLFRLVRTVGWGYLLLFAPIAFVLILLLLEIAQNNPGYIGAGGILLLLITHFQRGDKGFLSFLNIPTYRFTALEYTVALLPISLILLAVLGDWQDVLLLQGAALIVALIPLRLASREAEVTTNNLQWIPLQAFEWRTGLRQYRWYFLLLYLIGIGLSHFTATVPVVVLIMALLATTFYEALETKELVETIRGKGRLIPQKIKMQFRVFHLYLIPLYVLFLLFHGTYWYVLVAIVFMVQLQLCYALFYKYANYAPARQRVYNQMATGLFFMSLLIPFFWPGALLYCIYYYRKANRNMKYYYATN